MAKARPWLAITTPVPTAAASHARRVRVGSGRGDDVITPLRQESVAPSSVWTTEMICAHYPKGLRSCPPHLSMRLVQVLQG